MEKIVKIARNHLKNKGIIAVLGHTSQGMFDKYFTKIDAGVYDLNKKRKLYVDYFIGQKA